MWPFICTQVCSHVCTKSSYWCHAYLSVILSVQSCVLKVFVGKVFSVCTFLWALKSVITISYADMIRIIISIFRSCTEPDTESNWTAGKLIIILNHVSITDSNYWFQCTYDKSLPQFVLHLYYSRLLLHLFSGRNTLGILSCVPVRVVSNILIAWTANKTHNLINRKWDD